ncbi:MAG: hypothetical protein AMXMBFR16_10220 [Candidatus Uhrbacteria bacterium]
MLNNSPMNDLLSEFREAIASGLRSQTLTSCSRWAEYRRIMGEPFPGPYSFKYHPWCREITDSKAAYNTAMKAAQMGVTEVAINRAFYTVAALKKDVLYVLPTAINASDFSKARFNTALLHSPYLKQLFTDTNTVGLKQAGGVTLYIRGSRGDSNLKSIPVSTLILDELDEMDQKQIWLALERLSGHEHKSVWAVSTPTIPKYGIHKLFMQGTQEHWTYQCPLCSRWSELTWPECIEIHGEDITDPRCHDSFLKCKECGGKLDHRAKPEFLANGRWIPTAPNCSSDHRSFYVNQLYSYTVTPGEIVMAYFRGAGDEAASTEFHNSKLGMPYLGEGAQVTDESLDKCLANHIKTDPRPQTGGERLITMGIDQGKQNHIVIMEWFVDQMGRDINVAAMGKLLWEGTVLGEEFDRLDMLMREWQVLACVIDADPQINDARRFARRFPGYVTLCRYRRGVSGKEISVQEDELGTPIATVDRTNWIDAALGRFHNQRIRLPRDVSREFREHMKALVRTYEKDDNGNPKAKYVETSADHFAHALTYAEIALPLGASYVTSRSIGAFL